MPDSSSSDRGAGWVWGQFALIAVILGLGVLPPRWPDWLRLLGILFLLAGVAGFVWAARTLGSSFTATRGPGRRACSSSTARTGSCDIRSTAPASSSCSATGC